MFLRLSQARPGSCVEDCVRLLLSLSSTNTRQRLVSLVHEVYYEAFASAVAHIDAEVEMFSREDFKKEVTRLAVYCGLLALQATRDSGEKNISQFNIENILQYQISFPSSKAIIYRK